MRRVWKAACMELGSEWNWGGRVEFAKRVNWANTIQHYPAPFSPIYSLSVFSLIRLHPASPVALFDPLPGLLFDHFEVAC